MLTFLVILIHIFSFLAFAVLLSVLVFVVLLYVIVFDLLLSVIVFVGLLFDLMNNYLSWNLLFALLEVSSLVLPQLLWLFVLLPTAILLLGLSSKQLLSINSHTSHNRMSMTYFLLWGKDKLLKYNFL